MKRVITMIAAGLLAISLALGVCGCDEQSGIFADTVATQEAVDRLQTNQPTPKDISYSLERYNLIRRAYQVNGQREKANALPCEVEKPLGYIVLFSGNTTVGRFVVDGKVSSLNSYLYSARNSCFADVDGSYGENDSGIFFFTPDGKYIEWSGDYLYSDIPFEVNDPVANIGGDTDE